MDPTLSQILRALFDAHQTIAEQQQKIASLQAAYADLKAKEAPVALPPAVG